MKLDEQSEVAFSQWRRHGGGGGGAYDFFFFCLSAQRSVPHGHDNTLPPI